MALSEALLPEFDHEMANTRITLARIPEAKLGWKPHEKSGTMGWLATHLANLPSWVAIGVNQDSFDVKPPGSSGLGIPPATSRKEILDMFDKNVAAARAVIAAASDAQLSQTWTLLSGGKEVFTMPKIAVLRSFVMNHSIHHRAQLGVYLRLTGIPVPAMYGPSADEGTL